MNNNIKIPSTSVNTMLGCSGKQVTSNVITEEYIENYVSDKLENLRKKTKQIPNSPRTFTEKDTK